MSPIFLEEIILRACSPSAGTGGTGRKSGHVCDNFFWGRTGYPSTHPAEITRLLKAWSSGDQAALDQLAKHVYPELRLMARRHMKNERQGNTLQTTALVHEVYLRLVDVTKVEWQQRAQFFAMAAQMMRRILVDAARARGFAQTRRPAPYTVNFDETAVVSPEPDRSMVALDDALDRVLADRAAPGQGRRTALFRRTDRGGDRGGSENLAAHRPARLGVCPRLAAA